MRIWTEQSSLWMVFVGLNHKRNSVASVEQRKNSWMIFINKMDKPGADFERAMETIEIA